MRSADLSLLLALGAVACGGGEETYEWRQIPIEGSGLVYNVVVDEPNRPLVVTDAGLARYDGKALVLLDPQPACSAATAACQPRVDHVGTVYVGSERLPRGASAWESIAIDGAQLTSTPMPASDLSVYGFAVPDGSLPEDWRLYRLGPGASSWTLLGDGVLSEVPLYPDAHGNIWFDQQGYAYNNEGPEGQDDWTTTSSTLYRANGSGIEYLGFALPSDAAYRLQGVTPDGSLVLARTQTVFQCGEVRERSPNGAVATRTKGTCVDSPTVECECTETGAWMQQWAVDDTGAVFGHWRTDNSSSASHLLQVLAPGASDWEPIGAGPPGGSFQWFATDEDRIWAVSNGQIFSLDDAGGYSNWVYGGLWVRERADAPSRAP